MGRNNGLDRLTDSMWPDLCLAMERRYDRIPGTPIEKLFELGMHALCGLLFLDQGRARVELADFSPAEFPVDQTKLARRTNIFYWRQYPVLDWKVDFLIGMQSDSGGACFLVVECDGHEFHERTKEQAAKDRSRDRRLQEAGYRIHRYTGSEIYRDAYKCASDSLISLMNLAIEA